MKLLHISDLHFGPPYVDAVGDAVVKFTQSNELDLIVITGDLTQRAKVKQFQDARSFIDLLSKQSPVISIIGNHDIPLYRVHERFGRPYGLYKKYISKDLDFYYDIQGTRIVGLNSNHPFLRVKNGHLSSKQIELCERFFSAPGKEDITTRILAIHHHLIPVPSFESHQTLPQSQKLLNQLEEIGVHIVMSGHIHRSYIGNSLDVYAGERRDKGMLMVSCGTTTSRRGRGAEKEKNSLNLIEIQTGHFNVSHFMYFAGTQEFELLSQHDYPRSIGLKS